MHVSPGPPSSGEVRERLQAPEVVELPIAEVLQNGEEEQASGFPSARVAAEAELLERERRDGQKDPEQQGHDQKCEQKRE